MSIQYNFSSTAVLGVLASLAFWTPSGANAEPQVGAVSGSLSYGQTVTISGSGFGSRGNFNDTSSTWQDQRFLAFRVKDFNDGSLNSGGFQTPNTSWRLSSGGRSPGGFYATKFYNGQRLGALSASQRGTSGVWYISMWFLMPPNTPSSKPLRIYGNGQAGNIYLASGGSFSIRGYSECTASECSTATVWGSPDSLTANTWHRIEVEMSQAENGSISVFLDGKLQWTRERWLATSEGAYEGRTLDLGNMINAAENGSNNPENSSYNFDDVYIDFSRARVELGNADSWEASSYREVQVVTDWNPNSIEFATNTGTFEPGDEAFVYVVDDSGVVNARGFPVTIGAVQVERPKPNPPGQLAAQ